MDRLGVQRDGAEDAVGVVVGREIKASMHRGSQSGQMTPVPARLRVHGRGSGIFP